MYTSKFDAFLFDQISWSNFEKIGAASKTWILTLDPDPEKPGINIGLKNMSDFRELCVIKTMRNVIYCLNVRVLTDI